MAGASEPRRFTRLARIEDPEGGRWAVPSGGMCLSVFLLVSPPGQSGRVLFGKIDPSAPWDEIGALDRTRRARVADLWMLPSSHLLEFEEPVTAARRIAAEQLEIPGLPLRGPEVHADTSPPAGDRGVHWDLHFLFRGEWPAGRLLRARPFRELAYLDAASVDPATIARGGADILELAGLRPPPRPRSGSGP
jgi:ADP-ribose pyrophosphatase YjhB (NUDIX family)